MNLYEIVRVTGGDIYDGGRRASIPAPGHSRHDRSVSLLLEGDRLIIHCFGQSDWREVRNYLADLGLAEGPASGEHAPPRASPPQTSPSPDERLASVRALWAEARPVAGSLSERHARLRGARRGLGERLRHHRAAPLGIYSGRGPRRPALLAAISAQDGALCGIEITYLNDAGLRDDRLGMPRKTVGAVPPGSAVRLDPPAPRLLVGEGVFTTLSASEMFSRPAWALLSAQNLAAWSAPPGVEDVIIAADRGAAGEEAAGVLCARLQGHGLRARILLPAEGAGDWNDVGQKLGGRG